MTLQKILTALYKNLLTGMYLYAISMSLAYAGYIGQDYDPHNMIGVILDSVAHRKD